MGSRNILNIINRSNLEGWYVFECRFYTGFRCNLRTLFCNVDLCPARSHHSALYVDHSEMLSRFGIYFWCPYQINALQHVVLLSSSILLLSSAIFFSGTVEKVRKI